MAASVTTLHHCTIEIKNMGFMADELTHAVQQSRNHISPNNWYRGNPINNKTQLEREADRMGQKAARTNISDMLISTGKNGINRGKLQPFPSQLSSIFMSGEQGMRNIAGDISSAPDNPLAWYDLHSDDVSTITAAINMGRRIHKQQTSSQNFGAGLRITYSPDAGLLIYGGVQLIFHGL